MVRGVDCLQRVECRIMCLLWNLCLPTVLLYLSVGYSTAIPLGTISLGLIALRFEGNIIESHAAGQRI